MSDRRDTRPILKRKVPSSSPNPTHEAILGSIRKSGKDLIVTTLSGSKYVGKISQFDKFTVTIRDGDGRLGTIFKHAIETFGAE